MISASSCLLLLWYESFRKFDESFQDFIIVALGELLTEKNS